MTPKMVDVNGLREFLSHLGQCYTHSGIVYLVGGSSLLLLAAKESTFVGRFGAVEVFLFDAYSIALSKLQRGTEKDYADVANMIEVNMIDLVNLEQYFQEVLPQIELHSLRTDPQDFERKFVQFKKRLSRDS